MARELPAVGGAGDARIAQPAEKTNGKCGEGKKQVSPDCEYHLVCPHRRKQRRWSRICPLRLRRCSTSEGAIPALRRAACRPRPGRDVSGSARAPGFLRSRVYARKPEDTRETARCGNAAFGLRFRRPRRSYGFKARDQKSGRMIGPEPRFRTPRTESKRSRGRPRKGSWGREYRANRSAMTRRVG